MNLVRWAGEAVSLSRESLFEISRRDIDDDEKERNLRSHALRLIGVLGILLGGGVAAAGFPVLILWGLDGLGFVSLTATLAFASTWEFLVGATLVTTLVLWLSWRLKHSKKQSADNFENRYSATTRILHNLAFATTPAQLAVADLEDRWALKRTDPQHAENAVFITALPRAGTTLLLELCAATGEFATHSYRHMPFLYTPLLWQWLTRSMQTTGELRERAHGDGMLVNEDSPEAFEEMLWVAHWQDQYDKNRIQPWKQTESADFVSFFRNHMRKIVYLGNGEQGVSPMRYISKNNLNIARIDWLLSALPTARILVPFRDPVQHAVSLWRQHQNFLSIHEADSFARHYMAAIGHFDFGANLRPVNFDGWMEAEDLLPATDINFWLQYWIAAYSYLCQRNSDRLAFIDYDLLCREPSMSLERLAGFLQLREPNKLVEQHTRLQDKPPHAIDSTNLDTELLDRAQTSYARLQAQSLVTHDSAH
ncbi:sulfotransferase [Methylophaga sp. OBS4]|uniref:sulfotransferase n=1 Tax=Methylophaga sp. OBS4 TaxID=2991935 RepID=UPI0022506B3D|nr:sulfotransferase [Methylophaga sp. OBS4]